MKETYPDITNLSDNTATKDTELSVSFKEPTYNATNSLTVESFRTHIRSAVQTASAASEANNQSSVYVADRRITTLTHPDEVYRPTDVLSVGDLHGNIDILYKNLRSLGVINTSGHWIGGSQRLEDLGDIIGDRGTDGLQCMREIFRLRHEARSVGGDITILAGNHEDIAISYLTDRRLASLSGRENTRYASTERRKALNAFNNAMLDGQGVGIIEFARDYLHLPVEATPEGMMSIQYRGKEILAAMQESPEGREMLHNLCSLQIADHIDDTLFVHTELTSAMAEMILKYGIDFLNNIYTEGLRNLLLENKEPPELFQTIVNTFLYVYNRDNYLDAEEASKLRFLWINRVIHGHIDNMGEVTYIGGLEIHSVDHSAGRRGKYMNERSIGRIDRGGNVLNGIGLIRN